MDNLANEIEVNTIERDYFITEQELRALFKLKGTITACSFSMWSYDPKHPGLCIHTSETKQTERS